MIVAIFLLCFKEISSLTMKSPFAVPFPTPSETHADFSFIHRPPLIFLRTFSILSYCTIQTFPQSSHYIRPILSRSDCHLYIGIEEECGQGDCRVVYSYISNPVMPISAIYHNY